MPSILKMMLRKRTPYLLQELLAQRCFCRFLKTVQMIFEALNCILLALTGCDQKWPVARLQKHQFSSCLFDGASQWAAICMFVLQGKRLHFSFSCMDCRPHPFCIFIEP